MRTVCNFYSYVLNRAVDISVVVPSVTCPESLGLAGITPTHELPAKFPVLYLLHGFGNNHAQWLGYSNVEMYAEEQRIAVVTMSAENKAYADSGADDFMRFVDEELPEFVCNYFPVSDKPEESYIAGLSMGGFGALLHGITHPERYRAIGSFSGGVGINPVTFVKDPMGSTGEEAPLPREYDLTALADDAAAAGRTLPPLYIACGTEDFLYQANVDFRDHLVELGADVTWDEVAGFGHEWRFWDMQVEKFLDWIPRDDVYAAMGKRSV
ncbi:alpha/beta hydrolase [Collinsella intestinalis]|uniref:alpha/beta hydrolase n=1 Tax=Collinsella intestinalis TaxID=147207 RepID=UPI0025A4733D|nr:alpha/beta hydrolase-fold protein [Collinsella intestinalis]MDM8163381.1 alpha/beta hydrolase-fold protein [Collinsella intestinalis]